MGLFKRKGRLTPERRAKKYGYEIRYKCATSADGIVYNNEKGERYDLTNTQLAFRSGYLTHRKDVKMHAKRKAKKRASQFKKRRYGYRRYGYRRYGYRRYRLM